MPMNTIFVFCLFCNSPPSLALLRFESPKKGFSSVYQWYSCAGKDWHWKRIYATASPFSRLGKELEFKWTDDDCWDVLCARGRNARNGINNFFLRYIVHRMNEFRQLNWRCTLEIFMVEYIFNVAAARVCTVFNFMRSLWCQLSHKM